MFSKKPRGNSQEAIVSGRKKIVSSRPAFWLLAIALWLIPMAANAQCAMCRAALETEEGAKKGAAVNDGIVYLMAFPYLLVGGLFYYIYKTRLKKTK